VPHVGSGARSTLASVSAFPQHERPARGSSEERAPGGASAGEGEETDALPVLADAATVVRSYPFSGELSRSPSVVMLPAVQAAAVAAGGFVAGAAVVGLLTRRQRQAAALSKGRHAWRRLGRARGGRKASSAADELVQIVGSRSLLLDVHLLGGRD
jgi:hypothetical protein